ncbi:Wall-associated receptor kinase [Trema orientale]|uniref:Wall-associated receptor kinase n=1 Tax=Trema orientale TaxID=63057 RepID=A0A2P5EVU3_TREOI|nr:Wall-associated receptor kinase [Trema orientale]
MVPKLMLLRILIVTILFFCPITMLASSQAQIAKPGCKSRCGNVSIPYPFGIGSPGCFHDKWFEIDCQNSTTPFLRLTNAQELEVLQIEIEKGTLKVRNPITFWNCGPRKPFQEAANLTESPFVFSQKMNRFTAVSCNVLASMKSAAADSNNSKTVGACMSICDQSITTRETSCNGMNCCQTTIPTNLVVFSTEFVTEHTNRGKKCMYAFLVELEWFQLTRSGKFSDINELEGVPVVLEWRIYNWTVEEFGPIRNGTNSRGHDSSHSRGHYSNNSYCELGADGARPSVQCFCKRGFEGNPYIHDGCIDTNECEQSDRNYCGDGRCVNRLGSYKCYLPEWKKPTDKRVILGLSIGFGLLLLIITSWFMHKVIKKRKRIRRKEKFFKRNGGLLLHQQTSSSNKVNVDKTKLFSSKELKKATDNFNKDRILGQGGQGTVYKGMLSDGSIVAVKKSTILDEDKLVQFVNEVVILSQINHRNVVKLLGCCLETEVPLLVYEFIPNGTLSEYIHNKNEEFPLTWEVRLRVATEIAGALSYLHSAASFPIYHRDIKSTNILLDEKYRAKIADFGTSKSVNVDQTHVTTLVHGTFGYLDPEYFQSNQFTDKSDVYSFGVLLVELLTGQKAISTTRSQEGRSLATYFIVSMQQSRLFDILDEKVFEGPKDEITVVANIANRCLNLNGRKRPTMKEVTVELEGIQISERASDHVQHQHYEEVEYLRTEQIEPWDVVSTSIGSALDSSGDRHELPLLSFTSH